MRVGQPEDSQRFTQQNEPLKAAFVKNTWILLAIIWVLCLVPIPFTGTIAMVMNLAALVMTIVVLAKGETKQGVLQLLSVFILTPAFYLLGVIIFASFITQSVSPNNLSKNTIQKALTDNVSKELASIYNQRGQITASDTITKPKATSPKRQPFTFNQEGSKKDEVIHTRFIAYTIEGGEITCSDVTKEKDTIIMETQSGVTVEMNKAKIVKIERYQTVNKEVKKSVWKPLGNG